MATTGGTGMKDLERAGDGMLLMRVGAMIKVGMIFRKGEEPENAPGMIRHPAPAGANWAKFYFPLQGHDLVDMEVKYTVPECMRGALWGELVLMKQVKHPVLFGRFGEDKPFTFDENSSKPIFLRIYRVEGGEFSTLYIRTGNGEEGGFSYFALMIRWAGDVISAGLYPVGEEEVPRFLVA